MKLNHGQILMVAYYTLKQTPKLYANLRTESAIFDYFSPRGCGDEGTAWVAKAEDCQKR